MHHYADAGRTVSVSYRDQDRADEAAERMGGDTRGVAVDLSHPQGIGAGLKPIEGSVDYLTPAVLLFPGEERQRVDLPDPYLPTASDRAIGCGLRTRRVVVETHRSKELEAGMSNPTTVAVVGTGRMGAAMAGTLSRAGFPIVVYNRTRQAAEAVARSIGARVAASPREAAADADVVLSSLADDAAVTAVFSGPDGIAAGLRRGSVAVDTSTIDPDTIRRLGPMVEARGASLLDAPVSGSVALVEQGKLAVMVGGQEAALEVVRPVFDALAAQTFHLGALGAGATVKLAVNALVHAINTAVCEALVLAERAGVDRALVYPVFMVGAVGAPFVHYKREAFLHPEAGQVAFSLDLVAKDLELILGLAARVGAPMSQGDANLAVTRAAIEAGLGGRDMSVIAEFLRSS